jgi:serine protease inhibitor
VDGRHFEAADFQSVDLQYGNSAFSMTVVLPRAGKDVNAIAAALTESSWSTTTAGFHESDVELYLPKLRLEYERRLNDDLEALGMPLAFSSSADFTGMSPRGRELYISSVKQKTFVDIHEEGTLIGTSAWLRGIMSVASGSMMAGADVCFSSSGRRYHTFQTTGGFAVLELRVRRGVVF